MSRFKEMQKDINKDVIAKERMDICNACEYLTSLKFCSQCGCMMMLKTKMMGQQCPIGKWKKVQ